VGRAQCRQAAVYAALDKLPKTVHDAGSLTADACLLPSANPAVQLCLLTVKVLPRPVPSRPVPARPGPARLTQ
jgi:hypothetical protein